MHNSANPIRVPELHVRSLCPRSAVNQQQYASQPRLSCDPCRFEIAFVTDNDEKSKSETNPNLWESKFTRTTLDVKSNGSNNYTVSLGKIMSSILSSNINSDGKGMELSELVHFNGNILTFDDKTGTVYRIIDNQVQVWVTLTSCEGSKNEGFKSEWATVKNEQLYVGSAGYPWTPTDDNETEPHNCGPQWIRIIDKTGKIQNINWKSNYNKVQRGTKCKGYITHESIVWSDIQKKWFFAPRKCSAEAFDKDRNNQIGSNILISTDEKFGNINVVEVGELMPSRGISTFKFLPHSDDTIVVALKTFEDEKSFHTYITLFGINGYVYLQDTQISKEDKYEGIDFIP